MDAQLLIKAKKDIPLYFKDFEAFWNLTTATFSEKDLINSYATTILFKNWLIALNHLKIYSLDSLLKEIHEDINASFYQGYLGLYRSSHMHLRSVIELSLQVLYFYQHEVEHQQWRNAEFRIKHEELTGYLKKHPFLKNTSAPNLINDITKNWVKFSKYIHAESPDYFHSKSESVLTKKISKADFGIWTSNLVKTGAQLNKLFLLFFKSEIHLFPSLQKDVLLRNLKSKELIEMGAFQIFADRNS